MTNEEAVSILEEMWAEVEYYEETEALDMAIEALSAQPKSRCNTCRYINLEWYEEPCDPCTMGGESNHYKPSAHLVNNSQGFSQGDYISRQDAIDSIEKHLRFGDELYPLSDTDKVLNHAFAIAASCVYNLPSAQRTGEWEELGENKDGTHNIRCNQCGVAFKSRGHLTHITQSANIVSAHSAVRRCSKTWGTCDRSEYVRTQNIIN